jgi:hypothetical protein
MIMVPRLLADLVRQGLSSRVGGATVSEVADLQHARLREINPNIVIIGSSARSADTALIRTVLPHARLLTVSSDLSRLIDLDSGENEALTSDALAARLRR